MPSPVGHALAGLTVHAAAGGEAGLWRWPRALALVAAAIAPDLDLLLRFVDGRNHHQAESHSVGAAALAGLAAALLARLLRWPQPWRLGLGVGGAWLTHVSLDLLGNDTHPPIGLMAWWPFDSGYHKAPWIVFGDVGRDLTLAVLVNNLKAALWEVLILGPVAAVSLAWRRRGLRRAPPEE